MAPPSSAMYELIKNGDTVLIFSSISRVCKKGYTPNDILELLLDRVGDRGTLLFPSFNFGFCHGKPFDIRHTPGKMGALAEAARLYPGAVRTEHPIYSFIVIGANKEWYRGVNNFSGYGSDSPFAMLVECGGKMASIDLPDSASMTLYHHVEEMEDVGHRFHKKFTGTYVNWDGDTETRTYSLYVRKTGVVTWVHLMQEYFWDAGIYMGNRPGIGDGMRICYARDFYDFLADMYRVGDCKGLTWRERKPFDD